MKRSDDLYWGQVIERLDLTPGDLAAAEQMLAEAEDAPAATPEEVDAIVAQVTGVAVPRRSLVRARMGWVARAAAVLVATMLLTAAGFAAWVIWREGAYSHTTEFHEGTMNYPMAIEVLEDESQSPEHRLVAMGFAHSRITTAIQAIVALENSPQSVALLTTAARLHRVYLKEILTAGPLRRPYTVDEGLWGAEERLLYTSLSSDHRLDILGYLTSQAASGILAIRRTTWSDPALIAEKTQCLRLLAAALQD